MAEGTGIKLAYLSGPVDAEDVYLRWKAGQHTQLFGTSYLMQFYQLCKELDATALVITTLPGARKRRMLDNVIIENRPPPKSKGLRYHLSMVGGLLALAPSLAKFQPTAFVITAHQNYWFVLAFVKLLGCEIIPSAHCVMWRPFASNPTHFRILLWLDGLFLKMFVSRAMAISDVVADQLRALAGNCRLEVSVVTPTYAPDHFETITAPDHDRKPFRVLFNGRAEANKGIFDLLVVAARLQREHPNEFVFDICGEGDGLLRLRQEAEAQGLENAFRIHGFCDKPRMSLLLAASHVVIVPTRSDFEEGLAKSCVEAVLAGRPFVSSAVCPAMSALAPAGVEVAPDDVSGYYDALIRLARDRHFYRTRLDACAPLQAQFFDPARSYKAKLTEVLTNAGIEVRPSAWRGASA